MTVIINELEHVPVIESRAEGRRGAGGEGAEQNSPAALRPMSLFSQLRREAARQARLWAD